MLARRHAGRQRRPTPLMLASGAGDDVTGGAFVLVEQRPRQQSAPQVAPLVRGEDVICHDAL